MRVLQSLFAFVGLLAISCEEEPSEIGSNFFDGGALTMATVDTITIQTSTVLFDSLISNDASRLLVGNHRDDELGVVSAAGFFAVGLVAPFSIEKEFTSFTRVELCLIHDGYSYYDTLTSLTIDVHELKKEIEVPEDYPYLYNTSTIEYKPTSMGSVTYKSRPNVNDTVFIPLQEDFGRDIIRLAQGSAVQVSNSTDFVDYFHGFAIIPSTDDGPIIGFSPTALVRIYYMDKSVTPGVERYLTLTSEGTLRFNNVSSDRGGTDLEGLTQQRYSFSSRVTDGKSYLQSGAGLGLRVSIPYLRNILLDNPGLNIVNAVLEISPARENEGNNLILPSKLIMVAVDYRNTATISYEEQATLAEDYYLGRDTHYEVDITSFVQRQLALEEFNDNALVFTADDATFRSTVDRIYVGDQLNDRPMKLTLTCLTYEK